MEEIFKITKDERRAHSCSKYFLIKLNLSWKETLTKEAGLSIFFV